MKKRIVFLFALTVACVRCPDAPKPLPVDAGSDVWRDLDANSDAFEVGDSSDDAFDAPEAMDGAKRSACVRACAVLTALKCPEAEAPPGGDPCSVVCQRTEDAKKISLKPLCVADAKTVEAVRACGTVRCKR